jgi:hypothetical protein
MEQKTDTQAPEKTLQKMTFVEYWNFLRDFDFDEFKKFKINVCSLCGIDDNALRWRKRDPIKFTNSEKLVISAYIAQTENNQDILLDTLFP